MSIHGLEQVSRLNQSEESQFLPFFGIPSAALARLGTSSGGENGAVQAPQDGWSSSAPGQGFNSNFVDNLAANFGWDSPSQDRTSKPGEGRPTRRRRRSGRSRRSQQARQSTRSRGPRARRAGRSSSSGTARSGRANSSAPTGSTGSGSAPTGTHRSRGTGYYPHNSKMEGGYLDRKGKKLHTLQDYLAGKAPYVSVAMDKKMKIPYGTKLRIAELEKKYGRPIEFRVVDTGGAFTGRGTSRIDICTGSKKDSLDKTINGPLTLSFD